MPAHRQIDGVYQWEVSLPPASVAALLAAVCVDLNSPNPQFLGHLLWGPKSWTIRFDGPNFELRPLGRGNMYTIFGLKHGTLIPTKSGCRIELRGTSNIRVFYPVFAIGAIVFSVGWGIGIMNLAAQFALWI